MIDLKRAFGVLSFEVALLKTIWDRPRFPHHRTS